MINTGIFQIGRIFLLLSFLSLFATACQSGTANQPSATADCIRCHDGNTAIGQKILSAENTYNHGSIIANGQRVPVIDSYYQWNSLTQVNDLFQKVIGWYWAGSVATYANGSGCQTCHTHEGFVNQINGVYAQTAQSQGITEAQAIANELMPMASPPGCFSCHNPHENGDFTLRVANGSSVQTMVNATYSKSRGNVCVNCHAARLTKGRSEHCTSTDTRIVSQLTPLDAAGNPTAATSLALSSYSPHYGAEADVSIGVQFDSNTNGYKGAGAMYVGKLYSNSPHSQLDGANCVSCHMTLRTDMMSHMGANVGGHSFNVTGPVQDSQRANLGGCQSCHNIVAANGPVTVTAAMPAAPTGFKRADKFYFSSTLTGTAVAPADQINAILVKLADPAANCNGLLGKAYGLVSTLTGSAGTITYTNTLVKKCNIKSYTGLIPSVNDTINRPYAERLLQAIWNFELLANSDQSMGMHNLKYSLQLLYDSCENLHNLAVTLDPVYAASGITLDTACNLPATNRPAGVLPQNL